MAAGKVIHILWIKVGIKTRYGEMEFQYYEHNVLQ
jgi:hypothetical protein